MARIRTIKPEFWTSEQIVECSTNARLLFVGLWNFCDDAGRHQASCKRLKMEVFPGDCFTDSDIWNMVDELLDARLLLEYESQGVSYWQVTGWHHQKIDRPYPSKLPNPFNEGSTIIRRSLDERSTSIRSGMEWNGMEWNGEEGKVSLGDTVSDTVCDTVSTQEKEKPQEQKIPSPTAFDVWWKSWPKKTAKAAAAKAYQKAIKIIKSGDLEHSPSGDPDADLLAITVQYAAAVAKWPDGDERFVPYPATWLNEGRFWDDPSTWERKEKSNGRKLDNSGQKFTAPSLGPEADGFGPGTAR